MARMQGYQNRKSKKPSREDYPTPTWATRALLKHALALDESSATVWEPAANRGFMVRALQERFATVIATDLHDYGAGFPQIDFLDGPTPKDKDYGMPVDWIITNPPFNLADDFAIRALDVASHGVALFARASWIEGKKRWDRIFSKQPPTLFCPFVERVALVEGRVDPKAATQMPYAWFVWLNEADSGEETRVRWIPPCRKELDREEDWTRPNPDVSRHFGPAGS